MKSARGSLRFAAIAFCALAVTPLGWSQGLDVSIRASIDHEQSHARRASAGNVVVWLTPTQKDLQVPPRKLQEYTLAQKDKQFSPHILVVPTGSSVDFPNLDPFFHNVFSLFNGKRFDLGLYEAHVHRVVQFDREGVSYIFCNIHPEMGAVVVSLSTPYYGISTSDGTITIHNVPAGSYRLNVWAENVAIESLNALSRTIEINSQNTELGTLRLQTGKDVMTHHKNKFGESYAQFPEGSYQGSSLR